MTPQDILLEVFCLVDDQLQALDLEPLRRRGPAPALTDSEVITLELALNRCREADPIRQSGDRTAKADEIAFMTHCLSIALICAWALRHAPLPAAEASLVIRKVWWIRFDTCWPY